jgi:ParB/RepB/Spo0J family partition protein
MTPATTPTVQLQLAVVDPATLGVRDQAREDATPDEQLVTSVRQHGIIQPPIVEEALGGGYVIVTGHRRVGAAIAAGMPEITVLVRPAQLDEGALTLEQQIVENERRRQLSREDLARGYEKLALFGLRPEDIAAQLGEKPERIVAGLKVAAAPKVRELLSQQPTIDLEQAAVLAEFDDDPTTAEALASVAVREPQNFTRAVDEERKRRANQAEVDRLRQELFDAGVNVIATASQEGKWWTGPRGQARTLDLGLYDGETPLTVENHASCPDHAAFVSPATAWSEPKIFFVCLDWRAHGHTIFLNAPVDEERQAEMERRRVAAEEARARVDANRTLRRQWVHGHLSVGRMRPTATHFQLIADAQAHMMEREEGWPSRTALELLNGVEPGSFNPYVTDQEIVDTIRSRSAAPIRVILAMALAAFESEPDHPDSISYFDALVEWGYQLTSIDEEHLERARQELAESELDTSDDDVDVEDEGADA